MKVVTWNCGMAFRKKSHTLSSLQPDLVIVPECENEERLKFPSGTIQPTSFFGEGKNPSKGLGIFSYTDLSFELHPLYNPDFQFIVPLKIRGQIPFTLLAIWAVPINSKLRYISQIQQALYEYESLLVDPLLIVGDFNANKIWDARRKTPHFTQVIEFLAQYNISSLYHAFFDEAFGKETQATLYFHRKQHKPYHIDYVFGSALFQNSLVDITVGQYDDWQRLSDHVPLLATFQV